ncbi:hypothetical protein [Sphingomonas nostoxanthinifaciens]|uniref:hypothetical protein n=1 Tax=Sphingomonas nostoxanthinifaciens TaxID=2872652 RepID=UPI001CC1DCAB|nr:hypothetical protein [Sphingomonas nostoxanthinifaciens]UAK24668.1 hypothetical protein K8P63_00090 [Sphingomonas nostoxanthinifaciens]
MTNQNPRAPGLPLALAILIGAGIGIRTGQPTIGLLAGIGVGGALALMLWLLDRRRMGED